MGTQRDTEKPQSYTENSIFPLWNPLFPSVELCEMF